MISVKADLPTRQKAFHHTNGEFDLGDSQQFSSWTPVATKHAVAKTFDSAPVCRRCHSYLVVRDAQAGPLRG